MPREYPVVLLVDDHADTAAMYAICLMAMGFQPVTTDSSDDGFERACRLQPDVVVADVQAGGSGLELARRLREDARTRATGIIVLTGDGFSSLKKKARAVGCDRLILKPCLPDALALQIRDVLNQRQDAE